jgi:hypothetical protein
MQKELEGKGISIDLSKVIEFVAGDTSEDIGPIID